MTVGWGDGRYIVLQMAEVAVSGRRFGQVLARIAKGGGMDGLMAGTGGHPGNAGLAPADDYEGRR